MKDDIPVMQVYSQENFVKSRQDAINQMNKDARDIKDIATGINEKIYDQDDKLSLISKDMGKQLTDVKEGNQQLVQTREITARRNKNIAMWTIFAVTLAAILGASIYFLFKD
jgi:t-SNARE complex subunit (syntaxin)